jgi:hypothetical protein
MRGSFYPNPMLMTPLPCSASGARGQSSAFPFMGETG